MNWTTNSGYLTSGALNKMIQYQAQPRFRFRQFVDIKEAFGKQNGETVNWLKVANVGTRGGKLIETATMHETTQALSWGTLTVYEYGNSIPFTYKVDTLSEFDVKQIVRKGLLDDMIKCMDGEVERQFNGCKLRYVGTTTTGGGVTTNGTATLMNTSAFNKYHVRKMVNELKTRNVPGYGKAGGDYAMICSVEALEGIYDDLEGIDKYGSTGRDRLANGEAGRYYGCRFIEDTYATRVTYDSTARTETAKTWSGLLSKEGYMFGSDTVREAVAVPEEIRMKVTTDYGRSKGLAWYGLLGFQLEWNESDGALGRIIKWDSAA